MWKRKLGSRGTYNNLIKVFERAGYKSYADNVIRIMSEGLGDIEMSIGKFSFEVIFLSYHHLYTPPKSVDQGEQEIQSTSSQPSTYPSLKPLSHPTPIQCQSPQEDYVCISAATAKTLPKGEQELLGILKITRCTFFQCACMLSINARSFVIVALE